MARHRRHSKNSDPFAAQAKRRFSLRKSPLSKMSVVTSSTPLDKRDFVVSDTLLNDLSDNSNEIKECLEVIHDNLNAVPMTAEECEFFEAALKSPPSPPTELLLEEI